VNRKVHNNARAGRERLWMDIELTGYVIGRFLPYTAVENFCTSPFSCRTSPLGTGNDPPVFFALLSYGPLRTATCQNHVIYEAFPTVSLWGLAQKELEGEVLSLVYTRPR